MSRHIVFEGLDGSGKDTAIGMAKEWLEETGRTAWTTRTPSYLPVGQALQGYFKRGETLFPDPTDRAAFFGSLFAADMLEHDLEVRAQLAVGGRGDRFCVLQSRSWMSTYSYQYECAGVRALLKDVVVPRIHQPDVVVYMHADIDVCLQRVRQRDRMVVDMYEKGSVLKTVHSAMMSLINSDELPYPVHIIDTSTVPPEAVLEEVQTFLAEKSIVYGP
jgi:thymidylate kinase